MYGRLRSIRVSQCGYKLQGYTLIVTHVLISGGIERPLSWIVLPLEHFPAHLHLRRRAVRIPESCLNLSQREHSLTLGATRMRARASLEKRKRRANGRNGVLAHFSLFQVAFFSFSFISLSPADASREPDVRTCAVRVSIARRVGGEPHYRY